MDTYWTEATYLIIHIIFRKIMLNCEHQIWSGFWGMFICSSLIIVLIWYCHHNKNYRSLIKKVKIYHLSKTLLRDYYNSVFFLSVVCYTVIKISLTYIYQNYYQSFILLFGYINICILHQIAFFLSLVDLRWGFFSLLITLYKLIKSQKNS